MGRRIATDFAERRVKGRMQVEPGSQPSPPRADLQLTQPSRSQRESKMDLQQSQREVGGDTWGQSAAPAGPQPAEEPSFACRPEHKSQRRLVGPPQAQEQMTEHQVKGQ